MNEQVTPPKYSTHVRLVNDLDGMYYIAAHPELEGCFSDGETVEEALANLKEVTEMLLGHLREYHLPIPPPQPLFVTPQELNQHPAIPLKDTEVNPPSLQVQPIPT